MYCIFLLKDFSIEILFCCCVHTVRSRHDFMAGDDLMMCAHGVHMNSKKYFDIPV